MKTKLTPAQMDALTAALGAPDQCLPIGTRAGTICRLIDCGLVRTGWTHPLTERGVTVAGRILDLCAVTMPGLSRTEQLAALARLDWWLPTGRGIEVFDMPALPGEVGTGSTEQHLSRAVRDAQRAESDAWKKVKEAERRHADARARLDRAQSELREFQQSCR